MIERERMQDNPYQSPVEANPERKPLRNVPKVFSLVVITTIGAMLGGGAGTFVTMEFDYAMRFDAWSVALLQQGGVVAGALTGAGVWLSFRFLRVRYVGLDEGPQQGGTVKQSKPRWH